MSAAKMLNLSFYQKTAAAGLVLFVLSAWFSVGYHHPDEHFQIIEFCNYKLGHVPATDLPWEYSAQIRPALPVAVSYTLFAVFDFFGIQDPFFLVFVLRLLMALTAWFILKKFAFFLLPDFQTEGGKKIFFILVFLLWFMPYISVRFSSENQAALSLLGALLLLLQAQKKESGKQLIHLIVAGLLLGFSFYFRFQIGFAIIGLGLWLLFIRRIPIRQWIPLIAGGLAALLLCVLADYWMYGEWVLTPYRYFTTNIMEDAASGWGTSPWWYYFPLSFMQAAPPVGLVLILFLFTGSFKNYRHVFFWILVPFLLAHFMVPHKEMRFLFPLIFPIIYLAARGIDQFIASGRLQKIARVFFYLVLIFNTLLLVFRTLAPARELVYYYDFLYHYRPDQQTELICLEEDLYLPAQLPIHFYKAPQITTLVLKDEQALSDYLLTTPQSTLYLLERKRPDDGFYKGYEDTTLYSYFPDWLTRINVNNWTAHAKIWKIKELRKIPE